MSGAAGMTREERVTLEAARSFSFAAEAGGAVVLQVPEAPDSAMLNRVVGLGVERPVTEADVDAVHRLRADSGLDCNNRGRSS